MDAVKRGVECEFDLTAAMQSRTIRAEVVERLVRCQRLPGEKSPLDIPPKGLGIGGAIISSALDLDECEYPARLGFIECSFETVLNLRGAKLLGLSLNESSISGLAGDGLRVDGTIFMRDVRSKGEIRLVGAKITGDLTLRGAKIENLGVNGFAPGRAISLDRAEIGGCVFLDNGFCSKGEVCLLGAVVKGDFNLRSAMLENANKDGTAAGDALNLQKLNIKGTCFFRRLKAPPVGHVDLIGMTTTDVVDDASFWPEAGKGNLWLDGFTYTRFLDGKTDWKFRKKWLLRQAPEHLVNAFAPQPWVQCAKVLREMGHERDARLLLYHMHEERRRGLKLGWRRAWSQIFRITTGHGYRPGWSLGWIAGVIVLGAIVFALAQNADRMTPAKERFYLNREAMAKYQGTGELPAGYPEFSPILYSVDVFLPIVSFAQEEHWRPANLAPEKQTGKPWWDPRSWNPNWYRLYNRLHIALGWFFTSIAVLAFSGLIKRD